MPKQRKRRLRGEGLEFIALFGGFAVGYLFAEGFLARSAHPLHWLVAALVGAIAGGVVLAWSRWTPR